jgi:Leucine-rich repeat (LRR) protein
LKFKSILFFILTIAVCSGQESELILNDTTYIYRSVEEIKAHPEKVFRLNLSKSKLDTFPPEIFECTNLIELDLSKNKIEEIPPEIGRLVNLEKLSMANNNLVHLPKEIGKLTKLRYLGLNRNVLEDLPAEIGDLESLEVFEMWDNELDDLPDEMGRLNNLKILEIRGILFTEEEQARIDNMIVKTAKILMSPACNCK